MLGSMSYALKVHLCPVGLHRGQGQLYCLLRLACGYPGEDLHNLGPVCDLEVPATPRMMPPPTANPTMLEVIFSHMVQETCAFCGHLCVVCAECPTPSLICAFCRAGCPEGGGSQHHSLHSKQPQHLCLSCGGSAPERDSQRHRDQPGRHRSRCAMHCCGSRTAYACLATWSLQHCPRHMHDSSKKQQLQT